MPNYEEETVNKIKTALKNKLGIDMPDVFIYDFWSKYSENQAASWLGYDLNEFDLVESYQEYMNNIISETSSNIEALLVWSERKEDIYNIPYNLKIELNSFLKEPCYDNFDIIIGYIEENPEVFLDILYYFQENTKKDKAYNILFCSLADKEIQLDKELAYKLYQYLQSNNAQVAQSAASCLLNCFGENGKKEIEDAIEYKAKHKKLLKGLLNL